MGKRKSAQKLTLRDFHEQIDNGYDFSDVEIVSIDEEDGDSVVASEEATLAPLVTTDPWPKLSTADSNSGLKPLAKAVEGGGEVTMTPLQGPIRSTGDRIKFSPNGDKVKNGKLSKHLKKFPIVYENGQVMIPTKIFENGALKWKNAIVGCFVDKRLSYFQVRSWAQRVWKIDAEDVVTLDNKFFVFNFRDVAALDYILENGPYFYGGKHIVIKKWHPGMHLTKGAFSSVPVWVKLYNVPLESWTEDGLSYIASYIGNPLYLDDFTQDHSRLTFARVCIEVDEAKEIPKSFVVNLGYVKPQAPPPQVWQAKEIVRQEGPIIQECVAKERVGQVVPVIQKQAAKERVDGDKGEWVEVKRKKAQRTPLAISSSLCASSTANEVGVLESEDSGASSMVKVTNKDAGIVPTLVGLR
ncbi:hypothetical protein RHMOL_Rhmol09G0017700 [Rhododendron molle]|uniref:Uncharacterized protein n=1 Tax=Rhododendron molle TaxID=49168 RepID=A0ACC0MA38_RHOML|nr:hypothetical protein RHMOL_Rhmol09G0017700 [Rhododendron molle]